MRPFLVWIGWVLLSFSTALPGAASPPGAWYESLDKPAWTPEPWVFPVVWTTLYVLMGTAAWLAWRKGNARGALSLFVFQLFLNAAWTPTFFGAHQMLMALCIIVALWLMIVGMLVAFSRVSWPATLLLVPYLLWVSVATVLNYQIWKLNA